LDELSALLADEDSWPKAHKLFQRIRHKALIAEREKNAVLAAQYFFEEVCAKTIYNLSGEFAPFDADSPYWVVPNALALARQLNIDDDEVLRLVAA